MRYTLSKHPRHSTGESITVLVRKYNTGGGRGAEIPIMGCEIWSAGRVVTLKLNTTQRPVIFPSSNWASSTLIHHNWIISPFPTMWHIKNQNTFSLASGHMNSRGSYSGNWPSSTTPATCPRWDTSRFCFKTILKNTVSCWEMVSLCFTHSFITQKNKMKV